MRIVWRRPNKRVFDHGVSACFVLEKIVMLTAFEEFLDDISRCFITRELYVWTSRLILPFSIVTRYGPVVMPTEEHVSASFNLYLVACDVMQLDLIDRRIISLDDCKDGTWLGTFETRLVRKETLATSPYTATALLHHRGGRFKMSSMLNGRGHQEWT